LKSERPQKIPHTLYREVAGYVKEMRGLADQNERSITSSLARRERDLLIRMTMRILEVRLKKVFSFLNEEVDGVNLTPEERYLTEPSTYSRKRLEKINRALREGQCAVLENVSDIVSSRYVVVRFLKSAPSIAGIDLVKYGPFEEEDVAVLPLENAKPLIRQGVVQEVDIEV